MQIITKDNNWSLEEIKQYLRNCSPVTIKVPQLIYSFQDKFIYDYICKLFVSFKMADNKYYTTVLPYKVEFVN